MLSRLTVETITAPFLDPLLTLWYLNLPRDAIFPHSLPDNLRHVQACMPLAPCCPTPKQFSSQHHSYLLGSLKSWCFSLLATRWLVRSPCNSSAANLDTSYTVLCARLSPLNQGECRLFYLKTTSKPWGTPNMSPSIQTTHQPTWPSHRHLGSGANRASWLVRVIGQVMTSRKILQCPWRGDSAMTLTSVTV